MGDRAAASNQGQPAGPRESNRRQGKAPQQEIPQWLAPQSAPGAYPYAGWPHDGQAGYNPVMYPGFPTSGPSVAGAPAAQSQQTSPSGQANASQPPNAQQQQQQAVQQQQQQQQAFYDAYSRASNGGNVAAAAAVAPFAYMYGYPGMGGPLPGGVVAPPYEGLDASSPDGATGRAGVIPDPADPANLFPFNPYATGYEAGYSMQQAAAFGAAGMPYMGMGSAFPMQAPYGYGMGVNMGQMQFAGAPQQRLPMMRNSYSAGRGGGRGGPTPRPSSTGPSGRGDNASPRPRRRQSSNTSLASLVSGANLPRPPVAAAAQASANASDPSLPTPSFSSSIPRHSGGPYAGQQQQATRSEHVMWVGNVPSDATVSELWQLFSTLPQKDGDPPQAPSTVPSPFQPTAAVPAEIGAATETDAVPVGEAAAVPPEASVDSRGILSIFIIARSNCAFVNYFEAETLQRAVSYFTGKSLRPHDPHCPRFVCRVRKKDEEIQAGVGGQRGKGLHVAYVKEHERKRKEESRQARANAAPAEVEQTSSNLERTATPVADEGTPKQLPTDRQEATDSLAVSRPPARPGLVHDSSSSSVSTSSGSISYTSTNSSLLRHPAFKERFFILKSRGLEDLKWSVETGLWATQPHNEEVLDQAFRNSQNVFLLFSANQSGGWFGLARMAGPITSPTTPRSGQENSPLVKRGAQRPETIVEEGSDGLLQVPQITGIAVASPSDISPLSEDQKPTRAYFASPSSSPLPQGPSASPTPTSSLAVPPSEVGIVRKDMLSDKDTDPTSFSGTSVSPSDSVSMTNNAKDMEQLAMRALIHNLRLDERESSQKAAELEQILQNETGGAKTASKPPQPIGQQFKVEWRIIKSIPFSETRAFRNPWRDNRQVKVSRDGTELEPTVGREMMELFEKYQPSESATSLPTRDNSGDLEQEDDS